jgi:hypothetical protein
MQMRVSGIFFWITQLYEHLTKENLVSPYETQLMLESANIVMIDEKSGHSSRVLDQGNQLE